MALGLFHYQLLHQVIERVHFTHDEAELGEAVLQGVSEALDSEGGTIFKLQKAGTLDPISCYGADLKRLKEIPFATGRGVVGWVVQHGQPVKVDWPAKDTRFFGSADAATGFKTRNIIAAPIMARGEVVGVIEFLNKKDGAFTIPDLELVSMIGREVGVAFENARLIKKQRATEALLNAMTDSLTAGILVVDDQLHVLRVNPSALKIIHSSETNAQWEGHSVREKLAQFPALVEMVQTVSSSEVAVPRSEVTVPINGQMKRIGYSGAPVKAANGERLGFTLLFQDITSFAKPT